MNTLIVDDNDLNCNCEGLTLEEIPTWEKSDLLT